MAQAVTYPHARTVPLALLRKNTANPNTMTDAQFNSAAASLSEEGWLEPVAVVPEWDGHDEPQDRDPDGYRIVGGHHRVDAAAVLGWEEAECWVLDPEKFDADRQNWAMVKLNIVKGQLNPEKFAQLYEQMADRYNEEVLQELMGFSDTDAFQKLYKGARAALPPELQKALDESKEEIKTIDDLSKVLNRLFSEFGDTLDANYMVFSWGGKEVFWVRADRELWFRLAAVRKLVDHDHLDMTRVADHALEQWLLTREVAAPPEVA